MMTIRTTARGLTAALALALGALSAGGCGGPEPRVAQDAVLRYRMPEPPPTLDPVRAGDNNSLVYIHPIFDGLVEYVPGAIEVRPAVAASYTVSDDGLTYTFHLRDGVRFHNGREVTAEDVVYSLRRGLSQAARSQKRDFLAPLAGSAAFWEGATGELPGAAAPDPRTVVLTLSEPYPQFLAVLAGEAGSIVPREVYDDPEQGFLRRPVGCGPFQLESMDDIGITLTRFEDHWKGRPPGGGLDAIRVRFIRDASTALEEYRAGNLDFTFELPPGQRDRIREEFAADFRHGQQLWILYLAFHHAVGPFADSLPLRRAVAHAIDIDAIVNTLQEGKDWIATGVIPPGLAGHRQAAARRYPFDPERAKALMVEAGFPGGEGLGEIDYMTNETQGFRRITERLRADLERVGIRIRIRETDFGPFLAELTRPEGPSAPLWRMTWYADWPDPDNFLGVQFATGAGANFGRYSNPAFDDLIRRARHEPDAAAREALYAEADALLIEDAALVPIYWYGTDILVRPDLQGVTLSPLGAFAIAWEEVSRVAGEGS